MDRSDLDKLIERRWQAFLDSMSGLAESKMLEPGVMGPWSVKDLIGHVTTWEEATLKILPLIVDKAPMPAYDETIDAFNARESARKSGLSLSVLHDQLRDTHRRLLDYIDGVDESHFDTETPFLKRLQEDTYDHYREHTDQIAVWRGTKGL